MKKIFGFLFLFIGLFALVGCLGPVDEEDEVIDFDVTSVTIKVGETYTFDIPQDVLYDVKDVTVVSIAENVITALKAGETKVVISLEANEDVKIEVTIVVTEETIEESYTISYNLDGGVCTGLVETFTNPATVSLPTPTKVGYTFLGWFENDTKVTALTAKNYTLTAKWEQVTYTISYNLDGGVCTGLTETFTDPATVVLPTPTKEGYTFLGWFENNTKVTTLSAKNYTLTAKWEEVVVVPAIPEEIEIEVVLAEEDQPYDIIYTDTDCVLRAVVLPTGVSQEVTWRSLSKTRAEIDADGRVTIFSGVSGTTAQFRATSVENDEVVASITLTVQTTINPFKFMNNIQRSSVVSMDIRSYVSTAGIPYYLLGSVSAYLFDTLTIQDALISVGAGNRPGTSINGFTFKPLYVTVHDVGATGTATGNASYVRQSSTTTSWHYTVGNDGVFNHLPLNEIGYHAGDGTTDGLVFYDSGIKAPDGDLTPAYVTVDSNTGKFLVNGIESKVVAPLNEYGTIVNADQQPYTGFNNYVDPETHHYMIGKTYWNSTYKVLSNRGGNLNSIGIESTINEGSNIYLTWHLLAKLIGSEILPKTGLNPYFVKQHNTFSGKNCPQTMRKADMWEVFMDMVWAEYLIRKDFKNYTFTLTTDSPYINSNGVVKTLPATATEATYTITMSNGSDFNESFTYTITIPARSSISFGTLYN